MNRQTYLATVIRLFLAQPGAPPRASRHDWAVAQCLYAHHVDLDLFSHVVRLATLRRLHGSASHHVSSLAYYRHVLAQLVPDDLDPGYRQYVALRYAALLHTQRALSPPNPRAS